MKFRRERKRPEGFLWRCFQGDHFTTRKMTRNLYGHPACCTGAVIVRTCPFRSVSFVLSRPRHSLATMNRVLPLEPPSMQAKQPSSRLIVCRTPPPSRTLLQHLFGTSAYQAAPSASRQIPPEAPSTRPAHPRRFDRLPSAA